VFAPRLLFLAVFALGLAVVSAAAAEVVEVSVVRFGSARPPGGATEPWFEAEVVLAVSVPPESGSRAISRVGVALTLGWELPATPNGARRTDYYRAEAECVALETGRVSVRFYLPPELVKRDQLRGTPKLWSVDFSVAGRPVPSTKASQAAALVDGAARRAFQGEAAVAAPANAGLLLPQYLTPFASEYPRATPSFVRRDTSVQPPVRAGP
jgi:hypothetical protein